MMKIGTLATAGYSDTVEYSYWYHGAALRIDTPLYTSVIVRFYLILLTVAGKPSMATILWQCDDMTI